MLTISDLMSCFQDRLLLSVSPWVVGVRGAPCDSLMSLSLQNIFNFLFWNSPPPIVYDCFLWKSVILHQLVFIVRAQLSRTLCDDQLCSSPKYARSCSHRGISKVHEIDFNQGQELWRLVTILTWLVMVFCS